MAFTARTQAGLYYRRKNNRSRALVGNLTKWRTGLVVTAGHYVQSFGQAYVALTSATAGSTPPSGTGRISDGAVTWQFVDTQAILVPPVT